MKSFLSQYTNKRTKRGWFNFLKNVTKCPYGTLDADDEEKFQKYIHFFQENKNIATGHQPKRLLNVCPKI